MSTSEIREKLHEFIETIEDKKAEAIYTLFEDQIITEDDFELSEEEMSIVNEERQKHVTGQSQSHSWEEAQQLIKENKTIV